jgi:hypothetical protein
MAEMSDDGRGGGSPTDTPVTLEFLGRQGRRVLDELASVRDAMNILMEIVLRHDRKFERLNGKLDDMLRQMTAMVAQHQRFGERLLVLDERLRVVEDRQVGP